MTTNHPDPTPPTSPAAVSAPLRPVEELQALCDAATPGPWFAASMEGDDESWWIWSDGQEGGTVFPVALAAYEGPDTLTDGEQEHADAEFIAAARTALPSLLARLRAAEETLAAVGAKCDQLEAGSSISGPGGQIVARAIAETFRAILAEGASR